MKNLGDRFFDKVIKTKKCWAWIGGMRGRYGAFAMERKKKGGYRVITAHKFSYVFHKGFVPEGLVIDHLCRNVLCVNPDHLEAVTIKTNTLRGISFSAINAVKTHCKKGHEFDDKNTYRYRGKRACRICRVRNVYRWRSRIKQLEAPYRQDRE